ncbi:hypothetical protein SADUNF_Sadunf05G0013200 [Salix dunnii]|uniref:Uncharacterized protein n=1 Tax=Salix dunnii TaxID=1413687 RepID=A0A835K675_9ROSI|nr:hypothetical protein SADUNF_Sadunf05G0013200 [Salix dunnii]
MSLLDQLWDDTVAGPLPESGLGKLRKMPSSGPRPNSGKGGGVMRSYGEEATTADEKRVTRSIMIVRPPGYTNGSSATPPASPAGSTPPVSPFSGFGCRVTSLCKLDFFPLLLCVDIATSCVIGSAILAFGIPNDVNSFARVDRCGSRGGSFRFRRRSTSDAYEKATEVEPRNPSSPYGV